nr:NADH dehydrogenase subunit 2 [Punctum randolphii]
MSMVNFMFMSLLVLSPIIGLSASNWLVMWVSMEIGLIGLIPLLFSSEIKMSESAIKYFMVQGLAGSIMLLSGLFVLSLLKETSFWTILLLMSICVKLGFFPFHFWVMPVISGINHFQKSLILGPMKVIPLSLIMLFSTWGNLSSVIILILSLFSMVWGSIMTNNCSSVSLMIGGSSIVHSGWMGLGSIVGGLWVYFLSYLVVLFLLLLSLNEPNHMVSSLLILSFSGLPPFLLFVVKYYMLMMAMVSNISGFILVVPILCAVLSLNFYLKFSYFYYLMPTSQQTKSFLLKLFAILINSLGVLVIIYLMFF